ncbi:PEP/pyruvate-binding domain-containing protein [Aureibaculum luteum]|uniref:PEP/pyruvate-binding domain-containing protein n=1 Tax=Aureibaculum luteum TaxID=1548456 RepID=UPI000E4C8A13|nr:PEP/pyruvate-binding domain-containing protein [Aureibaculum luteum]
MNKRLLFILFIAVSILTSEEVLSQKVLTNKEISDQINFYKSDIRGPYKSIRWFCNDGSTRDPKDPCPEKIGGIQHATYKDKVVALAKSNHIYIGQILAYTDIVEFWDNSHNHSRLKQYQIGKYLARIDNGWINRKGQFYRGALQIEDEAAWGIEFYKWLLAKKEVIEKDYFFVMQSLKDIPHNSDDNLAQLMRSQSKVISDQYTRFMDLRVKIHNNPEIGDIDKVNEFKKSNSKNFSISISKKIDELVITMSHFYELQELKNINQISKKITSSSTLVKVLKNFSTKYSNNNQPDELAKASAELLLQIRKDIIFEKNSLDKLTILDIAAQLESLIFKQSALWKPKNLGAQLEKIYTLGKAATGTGAIELWEWNKVESILKVSETKTLTLEQLTEKLETARSLVEWSAASVKAIYQEEVNIYNAFEPLAYSFIDDRIRASIALQLGKTVGELGEFLAKESSLTNKILNLENQSTFRGLNPGYAFGELVVVNGSPDDIKVSGDKIYIFERAPADLKPVAGIATVSEGNLVSHVQLLARNLGIPNAALSDQNLKDLIAYSGKKVFYAVSNRGNVILKTEAEMSTEEKALFSVKKRSEDKIEVPIKEIRLDQKKIINLKNVNANDSGKLCGPKAANLGQLKALFPEKVVEGFVIPFGIFREHMNQHMPEQSKTYWQFLSEMFVEADKKRNANISEEEVENYQLRQLEILRAAIKKMPLSAAFTRDIEEGFKDILGKSMGEVPVFLRSDTNMEDLKDFTGAGLNLTIFNVLDKNIIFQGIKDVWASPYTERSFKWRQKYLLNPENVFPSILVIPSVDVDYSGVLITKGITSGIDDDLTIAFSRGAGGAVDGQSAESYVITETGYRLISPAREAYQNTLPKEGGTGKKVTTFEKSILNEKNINEIRDFASTIRKVIPKKTKSSYNGAYDVELGFQNDKLWLFQIRPFVENKRALGSEYLDSITPKINKKKEISLAIQL